MDDETLTRAHLAEKIHSEIGFSKAEALDLIDAFIEEVIDGVVNTGTVKLSSFGSFKARQKNARIGRNPKTKVEVEIEPRKVVSFYASGKLRKRINASLVDSSE